MLVNQILSLKGAGASNIITIVSTATVEDAAKLLAEKRIGAIVISDDGKKPVGILSERDIVRELGKQGASVLAGPISDLMTRKVSTCVTGDEANSVLERMTAGRFRHLPVVQGGKLVGIVSIGDVVKHRVAEIEAESKMMRDYIAMA